MTSPHTRFVPTGFTLVELLVVISIITLLLSLLMPALDKAIYQAELAICAANQRGIVTGVTAYAMESKRHYPHRGIHESAAQYRKPNLVRAGVAAGVTQADDLAVIKPYVQVKLMLDPLNGGLTVHMIDESLPGTNINVNYMLWWDWQYTSQTSIQRSTRLGTNFNYEVAEFDVLVSEEDMMQKWNRTHNSHPNTMHNQWMEVLNDSPVIPQGTETLSRWRTSNLRGTIDGNYGYQDGSVSRMIEVTYQDPRMGQVPDKTDRSARQVYQQIPERGQR